MAPPVDALRQLSLSDATLSDEDDPRVHCSRLPGANIMDVTPENINDYCCGTMLLVSRDVEAILPEGRAREVLAALIEARVPQAFEQRFELVCFKKVAYYLHLQAGSLERQLAQLATFWHGEHEQEPGTDHWQHSVRLTELSDARSQCAGACAGTSDARAVGKHICSLSRHPSKPTSSFLQELPHSLHTWRLVMRAAAAAVAPPPHAKPPRVEAAATEVELTAAAEAEAEAEWQRRLQATLKEQPWPANVRTVVAASVLCRGADKAVRMRDELARARRALDASVAAAEAALVALSLLPTPAQAAQSLAQGIDGGEGGGVGEGGEGGEDGEDGEAEAKLERGSGDGDTEGGGEVSGGGGDGGGSGGGGDGGDGGGDGGDGDMQMHLLFEEHAPVLLTSKT